jgi:hypothetical protein
MDSAARASARRPPTSPVERGRRSCARCSNVLHASASALVRSRVTTSSTCARFAQTLGDLVVLSLANDRFAFREPRFAFEQRPAVCGQRVTFRASRF